MPIQIVDGCYKEATYVGTLDYTYRSKQKLDSLLSKSTSLDTYQLVANKRLNVDDAFWYQAFLGFVYLSDIERKNERTAAEIQRFLFKNQMHGWEEAQDSQEEMVTRYCLPDGSRYDSLTDGELQSKMIDFLQKCYNSCHLISDVGTAATIQRTPTALRKFLIQESTSRDNLLRMAFALQLPHDMFNRFLSEGSYFRSLSAAVPRDLIILYCIFRETYDWDIVNDLNAQALVFQKEAEANPLLVHDADLNLTFTKNAEQEWIPQLSSMEKAVFVEEILRPCCYLSISKSRRMVRPQKGKQKPEWRQQYSQSAYDIVCQNSIVYDLKNGMCGTVYDEKIYKTVFQTETVRQYMRHLNIPGDYRPFGSVKEIDIRHTANFRNRVMSVDNYCRFLNYRVMIPNTSTAHNIGFYRMKYGTLPHVIVDNLLNVLKITRLHTNGGVPLEAHNIERTDIMLVEFYRFLMERWGTSMPFQTESKEAAEALWLEFFEELNPALKRLGYRKTFDSKEPFDAMLRICFQAPNPLECYNRILELNVLQSLSSDPNGLTDGIYPDPKMIERVLSQLEDCAQKISAVIEETTFTVSNDAAEGRLTVQRIQDLPERIRIFCLGVRKRLDSALQSDDSHHEQ